MHYLLASRANTLHKVNHVWQESDAVAPTNVFGHRHGDPDNTPKNWQEP